MMSFLFFSTLCVFYALCLEQFKCDFTDSTSGMPHMTTVFDNYHKNTYANLAYKAYAECQYQVNVSPVESC